MLYACEWAKNHPRTRKAQPTGNKRVSHGYVRVMQPARPQVRVLRARKPPCVMYVSRRNVYVQHRTVAYEPMNMNEPITIIR